MAFSFLCPLPFSPRETLAMAFDPNLVDEPAEYPVVTLTDEEGRKLCLLT